MALTAANVRVGVTGVVSRGALGATAPTTSTSALTGFTDLGYVGEDGVTLQLPGSGEREPIKAWQNGDKVRTISTPTEDDPEYTFVLLETSLPVLETYFNATTSNQTVSDGAVAFKSTTARTYFSFVIDVVDSAELIRDYIPRGVVTEVGDQVFANGEPIGYEITVTAEYDSTKTYNLKRWSTALKTP